MDITTWLQGVGTDCTDIPISLAPGRKKRKRKDTCHQLLTPSPIQNITSDTSRPPSPSKTRRFNESDTSASGARMSIRLQPSRSRTASSIGSNTPSLSPALTRGRTTRSSPTRSTTTDSVASGRSSPQKAFASLEIQSGDGIARRDLSLIDNDLPGPLVDFLTDIANFAEGTGVISPSAKAAITSHSRRVFRVGFGESVYSFQREAYGPTPSTDQVMKILEASSHCDKNSHEEISWNMEVHHRVLETALRFSSDSNSASSNSDLFSQPVNFLAATTANIGVGKPEFAPFQKIDFCLYLDPGNPVLEGSDAVEAMRRHLGEQDGYWCINHTDHLPLRNLPVTVSIESKRSMDGWDKANLQLAVWQAAQWNFLRLMTGNDDDDNTAEAADMGLPFIPGIVIAGHAWYLTATTNDGKRTTLWAGYEIGSTKSARGVYSIVCVLQYLAKWSREVYWPWFRHRILGRFS